MYKASNRPFAAVQAISLHRSLLAPALGAVFFIAFTCCGIPRAAAQAEPAPPPSTIGEVIVTGSAMPDLLFELPSSASVISEAEAAGRGADHLQEVLDVVPNVSWAGGTSRPTFFQIRGVGEVEQYEGAPNPSVGVYIDDIDLTSLGGIASLFDVEQVEVLRGPQGTRYGANALAGVIALRSADPSPEFEGRAQVSAGSDDLVAGGVAVGGPIEGTNDTLLFRFSAYQHYSGGFRDNEFLNRDDTNERDEFTSRLKLHWKPSEDFRAEFTGLFADFDNGYDAFAIDNTRTTHSDDPGSDAQELWAGGLRLVWNLSRDIELSLLASPVSSRSDYSFDGDWGNNDFWFPHVPYDFFSSFDRERMQWSEELRLSSKNEAYRLGTSHRWTVGLYGQRLKEETDLRNYSEDEVYDYLTSRYIAETGAVFGEYELPLGYNTALRVGSRLEYRDTSYHDNRGNDEGPNDTMWGGSVTLDHKLSEDLLTYVSATRGFKGGGVNVSLDVPESRRTFDPETLYNFETGLKGDFLGGRLRGSVAAFLSLRRDIQTRLSFQSDPEDPLTFIYITDNAARGRNFGLESELTYDVTESLTVFASGSLLETKFTAVSEEDAALEGREQSHAPNWQYLIGSKYNFTDHLFFRVDLAGRDAFYYQDSHDARSTPYHLLGAALGYEGEDWRVVLWGRNLTDEKYAVRGFFFGNEPPDFPNKEYIHRGDPLHVGVTLTTWF